RSLELSLPVGVRGGSEEHRDVDRLLSLSLRGRARGATHRRDHYRRDHGRDRKCPSHPRPPFGSFLGSREVTGTQTVVRDTTTAPERSQDHGVSGSPERANQVHKPTLVRFVNQVRAFRATAAVGARWQLDRPRGSRPAPPRSLSPPRPY